MPPEIRLERLFTRARVVPRRRLPSVSPAPHRRSRRFLHVIRSETENRREVATKQLFRTDQRSDEQTGTILRRCRNPGIATFLIQVPIDRAVLQPGYSPAVHQRRRETEARDVVPERASQFTFVFATFEASVPANG